MFVLDTNVVAELIRPKPTPEVVRWMARVSERRLHLVATVVGELARGVHRLPPGKRQRELERWLENALMRRFEGRVLPFDDRAALAWGRLMGEGERTGRTPPDRDCQIAAIALCHGMTVVTRNTRDFEPLGVPTANPWGD